MNILCECPQCGKEFKKPKNEYNRRAKLGSPMYCSRKCAARGNFKNFKGKENKIPPRNSYKAEPFRRYVRESRKRFPETDLDIDYLKQLWEKQKGTCTYTGVQLKIKGTKGKSDPRFSASIDRIDSQYGYVKGNVQFISVSMNYMKGELSHKETLELIELIKNS